MTLQTARLALPARRYGLLAAALSALVLTGCHPGGRRPTCGPKGGGPIRAIWVTRWDYKTARDIATVMENCRSAGFNTVLFQVRGNGTVCYRSRLEPWAEEFGGRDPGFDPLAVACREAHGRGLSLHAWVNVMPGWRGKNPPANRRQLYWTRSDWFWRDASGRRQPLGWYNSLNPCYPEVRKYLVGVCREIVERYPVDGLHLDYIRFPNEWHESYGPRGAVPDYPRDRKTLALFRRATGKTPQTAPQLWDAWRTGQVTRLVRDIRSMLLRERKQACLSAAVGASPVEAKRAHFQDARRWIADGLLDAVYPMNYGQDAPTFNKRLQEWSAMRMRIPLVVGVMFDQREGSGVLGQLHDARSSTPHFAAFAYNAMFERPGDAGGRGSSPASSARTALRQRVVPYVRGHATGR